jgi:hypothetical protein
LAPSSLNPKAGPAPADGGEAVALYQEAEVGAAALHRLQPGIAAGKERQLHPPGEGRRLTRGQAEHHLEADQVVLAARWPGMAPQVVLARRQNGGAGLHLGATLQTEPHPVS